MNLLHTLRDWRGRKAYIRGKMHFKRRQLNQAGLWKWLFRGCSLWQFQFYNSLPPKSTLWCYKWGHNCQNYWRKKSIYLNLDSVDNKQGNKDIQYQIEFLNSSSLSGLPPDRLTWCKILIQDWLNQRHGTCCKNIWTIL